MRALFILFCISFIPIISIGTTYYSDGTSLTNSNHWNTARDGTGSSLNSAGGFTGAGDIQLIVQNGATMTTSSNIQIGQLSKGIKSSITIENGGQLTGSNKIEIAGSGTNYDGDFTIENGGTYTHNSSSTELFDGTVSLGSSSTIEFQNYGSSSSVSLPTLSYGHVIINLTNERHFGISGSSSLTINGNLTIESTHSTGLSIAEASASNVTFNLKGNLTINDGGFNFYENSTCSGGTLNLGGDLTIGSSATWDNTGSNTLNFNFTTDNASSTLNIDAAATVSNAVNDITYLIPDGKTITLQSNLEVGSGESITVETGGQLNFSSFYISGSGSFVAEEDATLGIGASDGIDNASTAGNIRFTLANRTIHTGVNILYNGIIVQETGDGLDDIGTFTGNIQIVNTTQTVSLTEDLAVGNGFTLIVDENATFSMPANAEIITQSGTTTAIINGIIETGDISGLSAASGASLQGFTTLSLNSASTVVYNRSGVQTITTQSTYYNVAISNGSASNDFLGTLDIDGNLEISNSSSLELDANTLQLAGDLNVASNSELEEGTGSVQLNGADQNIDANGNDLDFYNLSISGSGTKTFADNVEINPNGTLTISAAIMDLGTNTLQSTASSRTLIMSDGTLKLGATGTLNQPNFGTVNISGGTIEFAALGPQEVNGGETYNNLTFSGSGTKTISSAISDINGTVYITETCTLDVGNSTFGDAGTALTMDGGYFKIEGSGTKPDISGTYSLSDGTLEFGGSSSMSIRSPITYHNIVVSGTNVSGSSGNYTLNNGATFTINSGAIFSVSNQEIASSGTANLVVNGTFLTENLDGFSGTTGNESVDENTISITLGSTSTIEYGRTGAQAISDRDDYANLTVSGSGVKTMSGTPSIAGDYSISAGSVTYSTSITFGGTSTQSIEGDNFGTCTVIFSGGGEKDLDGATTFNGTLTFTNGLVDLGNNDVTLESSSVVSSANSSSYLKINGTGRVFRTISNGTDYLFPIGENPYLPAIVSCNACSGEEISMGVKDVIYDDPTKETTTMATAGYTNFVNKTWDLNTNGISGNVTIKLQWNSSDQTSNPGSNNSSNNVGVGYWINGTSSAWVSDIVSAADYSGTIYTQERTLSGLNNALYYLGVGTSNTPLPVEFSDFELLCIKGELLLVKWKTQLEKNCSHFNLELSFNGIDFFTVESISGNGNSIQPINYQTTCANFGANYARIKQFDFDGGYQYSNILAIDCNALKVGYEINEQTLELKTSQNIEILNVNGALLEQYFNTEFVSLKYLPAGVYIIKGELFVEKIIIP